MPRFHRSNLSILFLGTLFILTTLYFAFARTSMNQETPQIDPKTFVGFYFVESKTDPKYSIFLTENKKIVARDELPIPNRVIFPNTMVTMDYIPERLNLYVDDKTNRIDKAKLG